MYFVFIALVYWYQHIHVRDARFRLLVFHFTKWTNKTFFSFCFVDIYICINTVTNRFKWYNKVNLHKLAHRSKSNFDFIYSIRHKHVSNANSVSVIMFTTNLSILQTCRSVIVVCLDFSWRLFNGTRAECWRRSMQIYWQCLLSFYEQTQLMNNLFTSVIISSWIFINYLQYFPLMLLVIVCVLILNYWPECIIYLHLAANMNLLTAYDLYTLTVSKQI